MVEIRFHGRGGQGAVKGSDILAVAAFHEGKEVQAFPFFGVERRGAPVTAFTRISNEEIRIHCYIYDPDVLVILDPTLICAVPLSDGLKENGKIIINSMKEPSEFSFPDAKNPHVYTADCSSIAMKFGLGTQESPIINTTILGAVAKATGLVKIESVVKAIRERIPTRTEPNAQAAIEAFEQLHV
ncbi:2-oxoacid:acceptor oxidoreductase family protein [candidate division KSB1 bacterium]|nr:2-oxoacid:acceptor oxidoreductase family protein [candidate division KSB1 bacterium]